MSGSESMALFHHAVDAALAMSAIGLAFAFLRLVLGPSLGDRVVALDTITVIVVVVLTLFAIAVGEDAYLDAAIAVALVGFLATVAFARYIERAGERGGDPEDHQEAGR